MTFLIIVHFLICVFLVVAILLQPGKSDSGIGFGSSSQSIFGSRGAGNFLTKTTGVFAVIFLFSSFILTRSRIKETEGTDIPALTIEKAQKTAPQPQPKAPAEAKAPPAKEEKKKDKK